ncbi:hypothetical protein J2Y67_001704 [Neobacillus niacini]|nr:hypothetical protein [Neobacillus niacini]
MQKVKEKVFHFLKKVDYHAKGKRKGVSLPKKG